MREEAGPLESSVLGDPSLHAVENPKKRRAVPATRRRRRTPLVLRLAVPMKEPRMFDNSLPDAAVIPDEATRSGGDSTVVWL
jgi:hypothetical protein